MNAPFDISDGIYGSTFYMLTGLHGMHVLVGTIFSLDDP
jgi:heme/copper-type cytochrome/quinol oxidase subunit 3